MPETPMLYVLNGPNLNLLGIREPDIYGRETLDDIRALCEAAAADHLSDPEFEGQPAQIKVEFRQTNHEGELITWVQEAREKAAALVINPAGYGHTSVALLDALRTLTIPIVECHLSNPAARERFRHRSYVSPAAAGVVSGFGPFSYELAVKAALRLAQEHRAATDRSV
ncbi:type II 3-dehydroquinate dehydratase [Brevundimonas sp.]|uniref:type II 3-dehydroquinate dehydratase n=1 Tax=Brevundimonas sp. TaxID=1871086 RepID=UPI002D6E1162|nr:type II 3-dehydroquinate dehydratase [Brevundimonas sp.]HYC73903.1 type II 3-dehydroquinate dehydratase [Brevundimonas sp.]